MSLDTAAKVTASHLARTAYLYVRQSTIRQVINNTESATRQYGQRQRAYKKALGPLTAREWCGAFPGAMEALAACVDAEQSVASATQAAHLVGGAEALRADMGEVPSPDRRWIIQAALSRTAAVLRLDQANAIRSAASQAGPDAILDARAYG